MPAKSARLGVVARLHHSLGATSCQVERNKFLALPHWRFAHLHDGNQSGTDDVFMATQGGHPRGVGVDDGYR